MPCILRCRFALLTRSYASFDGFAAVPLYAPYHSSFLIPHSTLTVFPSETYQR